MTGAAGAEWLTVAEFARRAGISPSYAYDLIRNGAIPARRIPSHSRIRPHLRIDLDDAERFIAARP